MLSIIYKLLFFNNVGTIIAFTILIHIGIVVFFTILIQIGIVATFINLNFSLSKWALLCPMALFMTIISFYMFPS